MKKLSLHELLRSHIDSEPLRQDCTPWIPATHPDGALYFYDEGRVRMSVASENLYLWLIHGRRDCSLTPTCTINH